MENVTTVTPNFTGVLSTSLPAEPPKEMLSVTAVGGRTKVRINSSSLSLLQTCARKSYYSLIQKWRGRSGSPPLIFGSAIHKAMEVFYGWASRERELPPDFARLTAGMADTLLPGEQNHPAFAAIRAFITAAEPLRILPDSDKRSIASGIWVLSHYMQTYLRDTYVIHRDDSGPFIERDFSTVVHEDESVIIELFGRIDLALRNEITGEVLPADHKTSSYMGSEFMNRLKPNHQYTGYMLGAREAFDFTGENFMVNGIQSKAAPKTSRGGPPMFIRQLTRRTEEDFAEFREVLLDAVTRFLGWRRSGQWPLGSVDACANWGGCPFIEVCSVPASLRSNLLEAKFKKE